MKKSYFAGIAIIAIAFLLVLVFSGAFYTIDQTEQVIITQFGQPVGDPITEPGLHFKIPFVQNVNSLDKRFLEWDGAPVAIPTREITYTPDCLPRIYQRMIGERLQIAQRFRSKGKGEPARIPAQPERDLNEIQSTAYRQVPQIRGESNAKAPEIYARAYTQNPQAAEFYAFLKTLETYHKIFTKDSTLVLSTDTDIFALLKRAAKTNGSPIPVETPAKPSQ